MKLITSLAFTTIISLPFYFIRCEKFSWCLSPIPLTLLETLIIITFVAWAVWVIFLIVKRKESVRQLMNNFRNPLSLPLLALIIVATMSLFVTADLRGGLGVWKAYFVEAMLFYLIILDLSIRRRNYIWIIAALLISGLVLSLFSFFDFFTNMFQVGLNEATKIRITGFYEFANAVPLYLGPIVALTVSTILSKYKDPKNKPIFYLAVVSLVAALGAIILSQSKGGVVGIFSILIVWLGYIVFRSLSLDYKRIFKYMIIGLVAAYFLLNLFVYANINNLAQGKKTASDSLSNRYCIWQGTRDLLKDKFVTGSGLNGYQLDYKEYKTCLSDEYQYPHNLLLTLWAEIGILGTLVFLWVAYIYVKMSSSGKDPILSVGLVAALVYIFVHGMVDVPYFKNDLSVEFWILLALVAANYKFKPNHHFWPRL